jgi:hypothetical protein
LFGCAGVLEFNSCCELKDFFDFLDGFDTLDFLWFHSPYLHGEFGSHIFPTFDTNIFSFILSSGKGDFEFRSTFGTNGYSHGCCSSNRCTFTCAGGEGFDRYFEFVRGRYFGILRWNLVLSG